MLHLFRPPLHTIFLTCLVAAGFSGEMIVAQTATQQGSVRAAIEPGGMRRFEPGKWAALSLRATNESDEEAYGTLSVFLDRDTRMQFTRRYWMPADSNRRTWLPIRTPESVDNNQNILNASVLNLVGSGDAATLNRNKSDSRMIGETLLALDPPGLNTGMITKRPLLGESTIRPTVDEVYETAVAVRMMYDGERTISNLFDRYLAPYPEAFDALDQIVVSNDRIVADSGGVAAVRNWIARGGHAWIMVDLVDIETVRSLIGNAVPYEVIDRVELNEFTIEGSGSEQASLAPQETWIAEEPVDFVRVALNSGEVYSSIDSWPASFSIPFGNGRVFFTTLGARGWRYQFDRFAEPVDHGRPTSGPTRALRLLGGKLNQVSPPQTLGESVKPILMEQVGYRVPSRNVAALLLGLSCSVIAIAGIWLARRKQLDWFAWVVPIGTVVPAIVLIAIGSANTSSIPATSSVLRLANVSGETNEIHADTLAAFYSPDTVELPLEVDLSGAITPDLQDLSGVAKRGVWNDDGHGRWEQVPVASGSVRFVRARESIVLANPIRAQATFGPDGLEGRIVGADQLGSMGDSIIAAPAAPPSDVRIQPEGTFQVVADETLSEGEFITEAILSSSQQHRQIVYRDVFAPRENGFYPQRTTLFVWGDSKSFGLNIPDPFQPTGATLFAIPVDIGRTLPGQRFLVPATFVGVSNSSKRIGRSLVFNSTTGKWLEDAVSESESFLQFAMPRAVLPCRIDKAQLALKIHAPSRTVEVTGIKNDMPVVMETRKSPSGILTISVDDPELLQLNENGALQFGVNISQTDAQIAAAKQIAASNQSRRPGDSEQQNKRLDSTQITPWQIEYLRLQASGETQ